MYGTGDLVSCAVYVRLSRCENEIIEQIMSSFTESPRRFRFVPSVEG